MQPKKFRQAQSKVKQMIFAYDYQGIIMTDEVPRGTSVTAAYYRDIAKIAQKNTQKLT
jgi:hypothetical protein